MALRDRIARTRAGLPPAFWVVWIGTLVNRSGGFVQPLLTFYLTTQRHLSVRDAGVIVSMFGAGQIGASLCGGVLTDRIGRRATMLVSLFGGGALMTSLGLQRDEVAIAVNTLALGFVGELYRPAVMAFVGDVVPAADRLRAFALLYWVINLSFATASLMGGLLSRWSYTALFVGDAATMTAYGVIVWARLPETRPPPVAAGDAPPIGLGHVLRDRAFMSFWALALCLSLMFYQSTVSLSAHLAAQHHGQAAFGAVIAVNGVAIVLLQPVVTPRLAGRDPSRVMALAALLVGAGFALHGASALLAVHAAAVLVWTLGEVIAAPTQSATVAHLSDPQARGRYQGVFGISWGLASASGPLIGGAVISAAGAGALWLGCLGLGAVTAVLYLVTAPARRARGA